MNEQHTDLITMAARMLIDSDEDGAAGYDRGYDNGYVSGIVELVERAAFNGRAPVDLYRALRGIGSDLAGFTCCPTVTPGCSGGRGCPDWERAVLRRHGLEVS